MPAHADVVVVGAGPVGLTLALLLARRGWEVDVLERHPRPYPLPRAVHVDDEVARLLADAGIGPQLRAISQPARAYEWRNATGEVLLRFDWPGDGPAGWPVALMVHQPALEAALLDAAGDVPGLRVHWGRQVEEVEAGAGSARVRAVSADGEVRWCEGAWVVGADGAASVVRPALGAALGDLGFAHDWVVVDVVPLDPTPWEPANLQVCDPLRPTTAVSGGPGRRRFELMVMPGEDPGELCREERVWPLLAPWGMTPATCEIERLATYRFGAGWVDRWRRGRLLLAGDAAHLMPPFAGQGMCAGIRDAANLAWKLDAVLAGAPDGLLDTYGLEREAHVRHAIGISVEMGKVVCMTDPAEVALRDGYMTGLGGDPARILPPLPPPSITEGVIQRSPDGTVAPGAGLLLPQGRVACGGRSGLLDDVVGRGWVLLVDAAAAGSAGGAELAAGSAGGAALDGSLAGPFGPAGSTGSAAVPPARGGGVTVGWLALAGRADLGEPAAADGGGGAAVVVDLDGTHLAHMAAAGHVATLVRPDHHVFGGVGDLAGVPALLESAGVALRP